MSWPVCTAWERHRAAVRPSGFLPRPAPAPGQDEYSDDDDPGYWREPVRRQDAFVLTELKHSDDESSPGRRAYHRCAAAEAECACTLSLCKADQSVLWSNSASCCPALLHQL